MTDSLLEPSLDNRKPASIYSSGALMGAAFFGGPIAVTIIATLNAYFLKRLSRDWGGLLAVFGAGAAATYLFGTFVFDGVTESRSFRTAVRAAGFVSFGVAWLMHRSELRAISTLGVKPRSPWIPVIAACLFAVLVHALTFVFLAEGSTLGH